MAEKNLVLFLDLGATRIKWVVADSAANRVRESGVIENPYNKNGHRVEIRVRQLFSRIRKLVEDKQSQFAIRRVMVSSQMHGFLVADLKREKMFDYVSWMDQRLYKEEFNVFHSFNKEYESLFLEETGIVVKSGLPYFNSIVFLKEQELKDAWIMTLPEALLTYFGVKRPSVHSSMIAGTGFYNIYDKTVSAKLVAVHKSISGCTLHFHEATDELIAYPVTINRQQVLFSIGYGDYQCAVLGSAGQKYNLLSVNIGTGSQVTKIVPAANSIPSTIAAGTQKRPFFYGDFLDCVTHIPSGRALNTFVNFISCLSDRNVWADMKKLPLSMILNAEMQFDLAIFSDAWGYTGGGAIKNILEHDFNYRHFIASLIKSYAYQYIAAGRMLEKNAGVKATSVIFSGGLSKQLSQVTDIISGELGLKKRNTGGERVLDETILGLKKILKNESTGS